MGKFYKFSNYALGCVYLALAAVPSLASAGTVSVDVSPTTGYSVTNRSTVALPPRTAAGPVQAYNPTFGPLAGGGAYQTTSSGITITAIKDGSVSSTTMSGRIRASAGAMKNGLARCLTSFRCNVALAAGSAGVQALFDGIDWVMGEGGRPVRISPPEYPGSSCEDLGLGSGECRTDRTGGGCSDEGCSNWVSYCPECLLIRSPRGEDGCSFAFGCVAVIRPSITASSATWPLVAISGAGHRSVGVYVKNGTPPPSPPPKLVSPSEIPPAVDAHYNPDPSDLPYISTGGLDFGHPGVDFEIMDIPSITGADSPTFIESSDGTSKGTYSEFEFTWTGPSKQPKVDVKETTSETTYGPSGEVVGTTTTIINGSGSPANNPPEIPTDCAFMPTVCKFIDWFTEPDPEIGAEPDFGQLIDTVDIEREFTVGSSTASCPPPFVIELSFVPSVSVSLEPFCNLADLMRPLLLSLSFLFSGMIILRT